MKCAASTPGHLDVLQLLLTDPRITTTSDPGGAVIRSASTGNCEGLAILLTHPQVQSSILSRYNNTTTLYSELFDTAVRAAAIDDHVDAVNLLMKFDPPKSILPVSTTTTTIFTSSSPPQWRFRAAFAYACALGKRDVVTTLLSDPRTDFIGDHHAPLRLASRAGHADINKILILSGSIRGHDMVAAVNDTSPFLNFMNDFPTVETSSAKEFAEKFGRRNVLDIFSSIQAYK